MSPSASQDPARPLGAIANRPWLASAKAWIAQAAEPRRRTTRSAKRPVLE
ncbi:hypothetical protein [Caulobacter sp. DWR2-3-1b2]|nr:hypothetical protein [Caulobacter sp.]